MSWHSEDKQWLKQRKILWKEVKKSLEALYFYKASDRKFIKEYFIYGPDKEPLAHTNRYNETRHKVSDTGLVAIWLHPSFEKEIVEDELKRFVINNYDKPGQTYYEGPQRFREISGKTERQFFLLDDSGKETSFFQKKEKLLVDLLLPQTVEKEAWFLNQIKKQSLNGDDEDFHDEASYIISRLACFFETLEPSRYYAPTYRIPYVMSCLKYIKRITEEDNLSEYLTRLFTSLEKIKQEPTLFKQCQIETAEQIEQALVSTDFPKHVIEILNSYRESAKK